jgi:uncharacterized protein YjbI with pentapeptide repeats
MRSLATKTLGFKLALAAVVLSASPAYASQGTQGTTYQGASLNGINMQGHSFNGVTLQGTNLQGVSMQGHSFNGVNLQGTNLQGMTMQGINPQGTTQQGQGVQGGDPSGREAEAVDLGALALRAVRLPDGRVSSVARE